MNFEKKQSPRKHPSFRKIILNMNAKRDVISGLIPVIPAPRPIPILLMLNMNPSVIDSRSSMFLSYLYRYIRDCLE